MFTHHQSIAALLLASVTACGGDGGGEKGAGPGENPGGEQYAELMAHDWTIDPGVEEYYCGYKTLTEDLYISDFRPLIPSGTHHVVLGFQDPIQEDGYVTATSVTNIDPTVCSGVSFGDVFAYVATVGSKPFSMPAGVAVKIPRGQQLVLGLHVLNASSSPIGGRSGLEIVAQAPADVEEEAEVIAVNNLALSVPPGPSTSEVSCTMKEDASIFAVMPHMHKTGVHMTTTAGPGGVGTTLLDAPYVFTEQEYTVMDPPVALAQGDQIHVACHYENPTGNTLAGGESTDGNEMCITFAYRYPAINATSPANTFMGITIPRGYCVE